MANAAADNVNELYGRSVVEITNVDKDSKVAVVYGMIAQGINDIKAVKLAYDKAILEQVIHRFVVSDDTGAPEL